MSAASIPYEKQSEPQNNRTCGAACLSMVYRSLGKEVPQDQIWPVIAKQNRFGSLASTTHLMAQDALNRGFSAVAIQARYPLQVLRLCRESGVRAILNHRLQPDAPTGHYTVLVDLDDKGLVFHDPFLGPSRRLSHAELLELWQPHFANSEIAGNVLIAFAAAGAPAAPACQFCHTPMPANVDCPRCKKRVGMQPSAVLGCMNNACIARMWDYVCCPYCDYTWTFTLQKPAAAAGASDSPSRTTQPGISPPTSSDPQAALDSAEDPWNLNRLFSELDKFCSHMMSLPSAVSHPELKPQIDFLLASKDRLKLAQAENLANRKAGQEQLATMAQAAKQREEDHRKRMEELNTPSPPLDGDALGRALLKNLGFTR